MERNVIKIWLQLFRSQTFPATLLCILLPFLLNYSLFSLHTLFLIFYLWLVHTASFAHNVVSDYYHDKQDKYKTHHPLCSGRIQYSSASKFVGYYLSFTAVLGLLISLTYPGNHIYALIFLFLASITGHWYNDCEFSKHSLFAFLPISLCWTTFCIWGYFLSSKTWSPIIFFIALYIFLRIYFQISVSGRIKEIEIEEVNELEKMGAKVKDGYFYPGYSYLYAWALTIAEAVTGLWIYIHFTFNPWVLTPVLFLIVAGFYFTWRLTRKRIWDRKQALMDMSMNEIAWIYLLLPILAPIIGYVEAIILALFGVIYFFCMNKILWDASAPQV